MYMSVIACTAVVATENSVSLALPCKNTNIIVQHGFVVAMQKRQLCERNNGIDSLRARVVLREDEFEGLRYDR